MIDGNRLKNDLKLLSVVLPARERKNASLPL
jgi:hypothetical protein